MTVFQTVQHFDPQISVEYDKEKGAYIGQLISRGGTYDLQGPDRASISYEVDSILRSEYDQLVRDVEKGRARSVAPSRSSSPSSDGKVQGHQIMDFTPPDQRERGRGMSLMTALDLFSMIGPTMPTLAAGAPILKMIGLGTGMMEVLQFLLPFGKKKTKACYYRGWCFARCRQPPRANKKTINP